MSEMLTAYTSVVPFIRGYPTWVPELDRERIAAYQTYEEMYRNVDQAFALIQRGAETSPIYIPNPRTVVNTTAHYMLKGLKVGFGQGTPDEATGALRAFLDRERFLAKFHTAKWSGVVRGDFILHLTADPNKPESRRLSINSVDPAAYFPVEDDDDLDRINKVHLVEQFINADGDTQVKKLTYWYEGEGDARKVAREEAIFELDEWAEPSAEPVEITLAPEYLPDEITTIPVYHFKNQAWQGEPFGMSELSGFERIFGAVNQAISDEELALALEGLGVYATDADTPTDSNGNETDWVIAPGRVLELEEGKNFDRVEGVGSVTPMLDHIKYLEDKLFEASGTTDVARGTVDVNTAESGIALAIKFMPTLAKIELRDLEGTSILRQFFFDWKAWHKAYEGPDYREQELLVSLGDKLPTNRKAIVEELNQMLDRNVISRAYYRTRMTELFGYEFPESLDQDIVSEQAKLSEAMDLMGARMTQES